MITSVARIAAAALAVSVGSLMVSGAANAEIVKRRVNVADIDFSRPADVSKFDSRISRAAYALCPLASRQNLAQAAACRKTLREQAVAGLGEPQRTRLARLESQGFSLAAK